MNFVRSSVVPHTIASDTAQKTNWKKKNAENGPLTWLPYSPWAKPWWIVSPKLNRKPESPASQPAPPKAIAKPPAHQPSEAIEKFVRIFAMTEPAFLPRTKPISRKAKPACMNMTRRAATTTQVVSMRVMASCKGGPPRLGGVQRGQVCERPGARSLARCRKGGRRRAPHGQGP